MNTYLKICAWIVGIIAVLIAALIFIGANSPMLYAILTSPTIAALFHIEESEWEVGSIYVVSQLELEDLTIFTTYDYVLLGCRRVDMVPNRKDNTSSGPVRECFEANWPTRYYYLCFAAMLEKPSREITEQANALIIETIGHLRTHCNEPNAYIGSDALHEILPGQILCNNVEPRRVCLFTHCVVTTERDEEMGE